MGEGDFRPSTARRPLDRFSWNLKYISTSKTRPRMQNFRGLRRRGWSGQIASLTHESFCLFFPFFDTPTGLGSQHEHDPPTSKAENGCHSNDGCLATGTLNLHFKIEYFKNYNVYELRNRHIHSTRTRGHVTHFWGEIGQRSRSQGYIINVATICLNSVPGGPINFILGGLLYDDHPTSGA